MTEFCLVQMPYTYLQTPSLALGILKSCLVQAGFSCKVFYGDLRFANRLGYSDYLKIGANRVYYQTGEVSFCDSAWRADQQDWLQTYLNEVIGPAGEDTEIYRELLGKADRLADDFIQEFAEEILEQNPLVVGCSSNFQQNNASLALLRKVKELSPDVITIMGGSNCALEAGKALVQEVDWLDYTLSGDGEYALTAFAGLVKQWGINIPAEQLPPGVVGRQNLNQPAIYPLTGVLDDIPIPDFTDYFEEFNASNLKNKVEVVLAAEGSRGCWWKASGGCTFCGLCLHGEQYRKKSTKRLLTEIFAQCKRYNVWKIHLTDCVLSNEAVRELPDMIKEFSGAHKISMFSEVKSNIPYGTLLRLKNIGFDFLQPGIEALQDDLLRVMNKGIRAIKQVEFLKNARRCGIELSWNFLLGFPSEKSEWVDETCALVPLLVHLGAPNWATHIIYQRHSFYFDHREELKLCLKRLPAYDFAYAGNECLAENIAYNFYPENNADKKGYFCLEKKGKEYADLVGQVKYWRERFYKYHDCLQMIVYNDYLDIMDMRGAGKSVFYTLQGIQKELYLFCDTVRKHCDTLQHLQSVGWTEKEVEAALSALCGQGLLLHIGDEYLALAVNISKQEERGKNAE